MQKTLQLFLKNRMFSLLLLGILLSSFTSLSAQTNTYIGVSGGNWGTATNWSLSLIPTTAHDVSIPDNMDVIIDVPSAVCNKLTISTGLNNNEVSLGANTLTVTGALTINAPTADGMIKIFSITSGTLNCGSIDMKNTGNSMRICRLAVTSGTVNVTGNITMGGLATENQLLLDGTTDGSGTSGGTLNLGGLFSGTGSLVSGSYSTVNFNGTIAQSVKIFANFVYNNIVINNTAGVTFSANVTASAVLGDITVQSGILNNTRLITLNTGKMFSVANGATFTTTTNLTFSLPNFNLGATSTVEYKGASQTVYDVVSPGYGHLIVSGTGTKTAAGDLDIQGDLTVQSSTLTNGGFAIIGNPTNVFKVVNGAVFQLIGTSSFPTGFGTHTLEPTSKITYSGGVQTIFDVAFPGYGHLAVSSSTKTVAGDLDIQGNLTVTSGILNNGGYSISGSSGIFSIPTSGTLQVAGTTSSFPSGFSTNTFGVTSTVDYKGTGAQTIFDVASPGYGNLKVSTSGIKTAIGDLEIQGTATIAANATFAASTFTHNITVNLLNSGTVTVTSGIINVTGYLYNYGTGTITLDSGKINTAGYCKNYGDLTVVSGEVDITGYFTNYSGGAVLMTSGVLNLAGNWTNSASGTISLGSATVNIMGNWANSGIFNAGTSTVNFNGATTGRTITGTITGAGQFYNLTLNVVDENWAFSNLDVANVLTVSNGNVRITGVLKATGPISVATAGTLTLENNASLMQTGYSGVNSGNINVKRNSTPVILNDFTYWSSPTTGSQTILDFSPNTRTDRIFTFHNAWSNISPATDTFTKGIGYAITSPQGTSSTVPAVLTYQFTGVPNNGDVNVAVAVGPPISNRLIGNPYPSTIDANAFIAANVSGTGTLNQTMSGTLYFWTHNHPLTGNNYAASDYALYNLSGGTSVAAGTGNTSAPTKFITSGQGFFIQTVANGNVSFRNEMRIGTNNTNFYRLVNATTANLTLEKHRIWLNLTNSTSSFSQALVGYIDTATNDYNPGLDGLYYGAHQHVIYSLINNNSYTIQARALPFVETDIVPLGYKTNTAGTTTISIDEVDGLFSDTQNIYLEDQLLNVVHDLKLAPYTFSSQAGTFNSRFVLRYAAPLLDVEDFNDLSNAVTVAAKNQQIKIKSQLEPIEKVIIYDLLGRQIFENKKVNSTEVFISDLMSHQTLIIKIILSNGQVVTKKIII